MPWLYTQLLMPGYWCFNEAAGLQLFLHYFYPRIQPSLASCSKLFFFTSVVYENFTSGIRDTIKLVMLPSHPVKMETHARSIQQQQKRKRKLKWNGGQVWWQTVRTTKQMKHSRAKPLARCTSLSFASKPEAVQLAVLYNMLCMYMH